MVTVPNRIVGDKVVESVLYKENPAFLVYDGEFSIKGTVTDEVGGELVNLQPLQENEYPYKQYRITDNILDNLNEGRITAQSVFRKVYEEYDKFLDIDNKWKLVETVYTFMTYRQREFYAIPYLFHKGDVESGKLTL